ARDGETADHLHLRGLLERANDRSVWRPSAVDRPLPRCSAPHPQRLEPLDLLAILIHGEKKGSERPRGPEPFQWLPCAIAGSHSAPWKDRGGELAAPTPRQQSIRSYVSQASPPDNRAPPSAGPPFTPPIQQAIKLYVDPARRRC